MSRNASARLVRALVDAAARAGARVEISSATTSDWASVTLTGARHRLTLDATPSPALDAWLATLAECDLPVPGHVLAELAVERAPGARHLTLSAFMLAR